MRSIFSFFVFVWLAPIADAGGAIYRCTGPAGEVVFSQTDCGVGAVAIEAVPVQSIGEGLRRAERAVLDARRGKPHRRPAGSNAVATDKTDASRKQAYRCSRTRQQLQSVQAERRRGYPAGKGRSLRERQAKYEAYLDSFCS
jgi:hypothetical protein